MQGGIQCLVSTVKPHDAVSNTVFSEHCEATECREQYNVQCAAHCGATECRENYSVQGAMHFVAT